MSRSHSRDIPHRINAGLLIAIGQAIFGAFQAIVEQCAAARDGDMVDAMKGRKRVSLSRRAGAKRTFFQSLREEDANVSRREKRQLWREVRLKARSTDDDQLEGMIHETRLGMMRGDPSEPTKCDNWVADFLSGYSGAPVDEIQEMMLAEDHDDDD